MKLDLLDNPLTLSLIIYLLIILILYLQKPELFEKEKKKENSNFIDRNTPFLFLLLPILIYGLVSGLVAVSNRKKYCKLLSMKNADLQLQMCN